MSLTHYNHNAAEYFRQYQSLTFKQVHDGWLSLLPEQPGLALDIGAGSGRDSQALAELKWDVLAVEPADELRKLGEIATAKQSIQWLNDSMPELAKIRKLSYRFDLILVSAVWCLDAYHTFLSRTCFSYSDRIIGTVWNTNNNITTWPR